MTTKTIPTATLQPAERDRNKPLETMTIEEAVQILRGWGGYTPTNTWSCEIDQVRKLLEPIARFHPDIREHCDRIVLKPKVGMGATQIGYSDRHPYEIVKVISPVTIEVRGMKATIDPTWKRDFIPGGFCGHTANNHEQRWILESSPEAPVLRLRLLKNGRWHSTKQGTFVIGYALNFYDYNF